LFGFRNKNQFSNETSEINEKLLTTEGEEWIRKAAHAAAEADTLRNPWTLVVGPRGLHLFAFSVQRAEAADGRIRFPHPPRADRTACGACENVRTRTSRPKAASGPDVKFTDSSLLAALLRLSREHG
jgi:hypothetical protein